MAKGFKTGGRTKQPIEWIETETGCFVCTSHKAKSEYKGHTSGRIKREGETIPLYRFIFTVLFGEIPKGLVIRHKCDNGQCINPEHLELGTPKQNSADMVERGRNKNGPRKINEQKAIEIRKLVESGMKQTEIAKMFNLSKGAVNDIVKGRTWVNLERRFN